MSQSPLRIMLLAPGHSIHSQRFLGWLQTTGQRILFVDATRPANLSQQHTRFAAYRHIHPTFDVIRRGYLQWLAHLFRPQIVHVHQINWRAVDCARIGLQPLVLTAWGSDINQHFATPPKNTAVHNLRNALRSAAHLFADSPQVITRAQTLAGQPLQTSLMFFGIDPQRFEPVPSAQIAVWREQLSITPQTRLLLSIRGWKNLYQHEEILRAFAAALPRLNFPAILLFKPYPPGTSDYEAHLRALAQTLGVLQNIRFLPPIPDDEMPALYHLADAIVNYPLQDGFPVSFLEAAAAGCPILTIDHPAYHAAGLQNHLVLVPPNNPAALTEGMLTVLNAPRTAYSQALRDWAAEHADEHRSIEHLLSIYNHLKKSS